MRGARRTVTAIIITQMTLETVVHQLARVYGLPTGLADPREWGPVQLYVASRYPGCTSGTNLHGCPGAGPGAGRHAAAPDRARGGCAPGAHPR